jgi:hypothetical protein
MKSLVKYIINALLWRVHERPLKQLTEACRLMASTRRITQNAQLQ